MKHTVGRVVVPFAARINEQNLRKKLSMSIRRTGKLDTIGMMVRCKRAPREVAVIATIM
jgi:hypothetical protein